jgi:hypothetical protein
MFAGSVSNPTRFVNVTLDQPVRLGVPFLKLKPAGLTPRGFIFMPPQVEDRSPRRVGMTRPIAETGASGAGQVGQFPKLSFAPVKRF